MVSPFPFPWPRTTESFPRFRYTLGQKQKWRGLVEHFWLVGFYVSADKVVRINKILMIGSMFGGTVGVM